MKPSCPLSKSNLLASTSQFGWSMLVKFPNFWPPLGLHMSAMLRLYYFPLMAKGLGPALVAELSGLPWLGPKDLGFTRDDWPKLKDWSLEVADLFWVDSPWALKKMEDEEENIVPGKPSCKRFANSDWFVCKLFWSFLGIYGSRWVVLLGTIWGSAMAVCHGSGKTKLPDLGGLLPELTVKECGKTVLRLRIVGFLIFGMPYMKIRKKKTSVLQLLLPTWGTSPSCHPMAMDGQLA